MSETTRRGRKLVQIGSSKQTSQPLASAVAQVIDRLHAGAQMLGNGRRGQVLLQLEKNRLLLLPAGKLVDGILQLHAQLDLLESLVRPHVLQGVQIIQDPVAAGLSLVFTTSIQPAMPDNTMPPARAAASEVVPIKAGPAPS